jgi:hypothetical protein
LYFIAGNPRQGIIFCSINGSTVVLSVKGFSMRIRTLLFVWAVVFSLCPVQAGDNVPLTFLDTLNKGRELAIIISDTAGQSKASASPIGVTTLAKTNDRGQGIAERREVGTVPSRFTVQVLASTQEYQVKQERRNVKTKVKLPVSISFEAPYYKLMVGDFSVRGEAENALAQLKKLGYNDAWIVRTAAEPKR